MIGTKQMPDIVEFNATNDSTSGVISFSKWKGGRILNEGADSITFTWQERAYPDGEWCDCVDIAAVTLDANESTQIPLALYGCYELRLKASTAGPFPLVASLAS